MQARDNKTSTQTKSQCPPSQTDGGTFASSQYGKESFKTTDLLHEIDALRTRLSKLSEASRLVSESLDLEVVLKEVIDNARSLTGARYGALLTYEQSGGIQDFITSGLSSDEIQLLNTSPKGLGLLGYMNEIDGPLRVSNISSHPSSVGFPKNHPPMKTFLGMPIRHRGEHVGNIYLTEKDGGHEFTSEDQDILVMFASQAGAAISNARRYMVEHQARANLEALLALAPVGMMVVDAATRQVESVNVEAERITGVGPGVSLDEFRDRASYSLPEGREFPIERHPLQAALKGEDDIRAEELVFVARGGRDTNCIVNAKAIRSEQGDLVSAVGTLLDITPLEDLKRQRSEFLQNVSHELRTPLSAIKGSASTVLSSPYPPDPSEIRQFLRVIDEQSDRMRDIINDLVDMTQIESGTLSVSLEPTDVTDLLNQAGEVHIHAGEAKVDIELDLAPGLPRVIADQRRILQVLSNLICRAPRFHSRSPAVKISASQRNQYVAITVITQLPGMATGQSLHHWEGPSIVSGEVSGKRDSKDDLRIAICEGIVEAHGGRFLAEEGDNIRGSGFTFTIPAERTTEKTDEKGSVEPSADHGSERGEERVLAVTDDPETSRYIRNALSSAGFTAIRTCTVYEADRVIDAQKPHVVLVEPVLPWDDGFELLQHIDKASDAPVILVAGPGWDQHIGTAFGRGAFDYIAKPFTSTELVARTELAIRKGKYFDIGESSKAFEFGDLHIGYAEREVTVAGIPVHLTATEFKLLTELSVAAGRVLSHQQLLRRVWGPLYTNDHRIVRTYVKELRHKLGDDARHPTYIFTEPGVGYRMAKPLTE